MLRKDSAQETVIQNPDRYTCMICLEVLHEPVLTACGHHFCKACLDTWAEKNEWCPLNCQKLTDADKFVDNLVSREIRNLKTRCPNAQMGCTEQLSPPEVNDHIKVCPHRPRLHSEISIDCPFRKHGCTFQAISSDQMDAHTKHDMPKHLNMLLNAFTQGSSLDLKSIEATKLWDPPSKNANQNGSSNSSDADHNDSRMSDSASRNSNQDALLRALYERIVILEQLSREQSLQIEQMGGQLSRLSTANSGEPSARHSDGILIWKISQFSSKVRAMNTSPNIMYWSKDTYTSPHGYRFCARINISVKSEIGLHWHMMQSDNDFHLDWPFRGCFKISIVHRDQSQTRYEKIMSNEKIGAFQRPKVEVSPCGFGFANFANIDEIQRLGYILDDTLTIKFHISIV